MVIVDIVEAASNFDVIPLVLPFKKVTLLTPSFCTLIELKIILPLLGFDEVNSKASLLALLKSASIFNFKSPEIAPILTSVYFFAVSCKSRVAPFVFNTPSILPLSPNFKVASFSKTVVPSPAIFLFKTTFSPATLNIPVLINSPFKLSIEEFSVPLLVILF